MTPRWSVAGGGQSGLPASMAGLPVSKACVSVGPPLFWRVPRRGLVLGRSPHSGQAARVITIDVVALRSYITCTVSAAWVIGHYAVTQLNKHANVAVTTSLTGCIPANGAKFDGHSASIVGDATTDTRATC